jgi:predicted nuclease of predicted toxin-antitoxin system
MRFLADENCDRLLIEGLRGAGHDVLYAVESLRAADDTTLFELAHLESRIILSNDIDFGHITKAAEKRHPAVVLLRLDPLKQAPAAKRTIAALQSLGDSIEGYFVVIEPGQVRLRAFETPWT